MNNMLSKNNQLHVFVFCFQKVLKILFWGRPFQQVFYVKHIYILLHRIKDDENFPSNSLSARLKLISYKKDSNTTITSFLAKNCLHRHNTVSEM